MRFFGWLNFVIIGLVLVVLSVCVFFLIVDDIVVWNVLFADGFWLVDWLLLPDGRLMQVWWYGDWGLVYIGWFLR